MSAYPSLPFNEDFNAIPRDGRMVDDAADGLARVRKLHNDRWEFQFTHKALNPTQSALLDAHYTSNANASFDFTSPHDSATYTVAYVSRPVPKLFNGLALKSYTVRLRQTA